ncbi:MAG: acylphosphatase [Anaerolineales bacterium]|nr:acylphosphatase [Anaerolineales bacterium]
MEDETLQQVHAVVHGRVQGVSFRYYTVLEAERLGIMGWVRNLPDGTVEVTAQGTPDQLQAFAEFLYRGSPAAEVTHVESTTQPLISRFAQFSVRYG